MMIDLEALYYSLKYGGGYVDIAGVYLERTKGIGQVRVKLVIDKFVADPSAGPFEIRGHRATEHLWQGEIDIQEPNVYLLKASLIAYGINEPIAELAFSPFVGHYIWCPPMQQTPEDDD